MPKARKPYTKEYKAEAFRLVLEKHLRCSEVARDLSIDPSVLHD